MSPTLSREVERGGVEEEGDGEGLKLKERTIDFFFLQTE
jgi:hypothetical protein